MKPPGGTLTTTAASTVRQHFEKRDPEVRAIYTAILRAARKLGPVREDPKKTSIHLVRKTVFAGVGTRKTALILTLKSEVDIASPRIVKHERPSANRWYLYVRLEDVEDVNRELLKWLGRSYALSA